MNIRADLHIHTALSPCADNEMTPNNIINMAILKGLDVIAITDHNSCKNALACINASRGKNLIIIPGMELQTREDIHVLCLFSKIDEALLFQDIVYSELPDINNKTNLLGEQILYDSDDNITGYENRLLINSTDISFDEAYFKVTNLNGAFIPAHIDKESYSVIWNLGFVPDYLNIKTVEYFNKERINEYMSRGIVGRNYKLIKSSDAHYLYEIMEREFSQEIKIEGEKFNCGDVISILRGV